MLHIILGCRKGKETEATLKVAIPYNFYFIKISSLRFLPRRLQSCRITILRKNKWDRCKVKGKIRKYVGTKNYFKFEVVLKYVPHIHTDIISSGSITKETCR